MFRYAERQALFGSLLVILSVLLGLDHGPRIEDYRQVSPGFTIC